MMDTNDDASDGLDTTDAADEISPTGKRRYQEFLDDHWVRSFFRPLLIILLATSVAPVVVTVLAALTRWRMGYVLPLAFLVATGAVYGTIERGRPQWRDRRGMLIRVSEVALILLASRLCTWFFATGLPGPRELALWLRQPSAFFDGQFIIISTLLLSIWALAIAVTADFSELAIQPDEAAAQEASSWDDSRSQSRAVRAKSRLDTVGQFAWLWGIGAVVLAMCAAMSRATLSLNSSGAPIFGLSRANLPGEVLVALLCYFLSGLLLMSEGRLAVLRGQWYNQGISVMPGVLQRWHLGSLAIVLGIALLAAILPLASTGGLASVLETIIGAFVFVGQYVLAFLFFLISLLLYPLRFLFSQQKDASGPAETPRFEMPDQAAAASRLPPWLGGAIYWVLIAVVLLYLIISYLNAHGFLAGIRSLRWLRLRFWWRARWARIARTAAAATAALRKRLVTTRLPRLTGRPPGVRLGDLPPAARIRYFYLATLERAAAAGLVRPPHKTPLEFGRDLTGQWPDSEVELQELTEAFLAARYDRRTIPAEKAQDVQSIWRRVMHSLHRPKGEGEARD